MERAVEVDRYKQLRNESLHVMPNDRFAVISDINKTPKVIITFLSTSLLLQRDGDWCWNVSSHSLVMSNLSHSSHPLLVESVFMEFAKHFLYIILQFSALVKHNVRPTLSSPLPSSFYWRVLLYISFASRFDSIFNVTHETCKKQVFSLST